MPALTALVTGHSAGAYASITAAALVARHYPSARVYQLGDSGIGVNAVQGNAPPSWNVAAHYPADLGDLSSIRGTDDLYRAVARAFPQAVLAEYSSAFDGVAAFYYKYYGGVGVRAWAAGARSNFADLQGTVPRFRSWLAPGSTHTIVNQPDFYNLTTGGVRFVDWFGGLLSDALPANVECGDDCGGPAFGDQGAPEEWSCLSAPGPAPKPEAATVPAVFRLTNQEGAAAPNVAVRVCAASDTACGSPLATVQTNGLGMAALSLPTGAAGFDGFLLTRGDGSFPDRFYFRPPVRRPSHPWLMGASWAYSTPAYVGTLGKDFGIAVDAGRGTLAVAPLDCAGTATKQVTVSVDGRAADRYWDKSGSNKTGGYIAYFLNLPEGDHEVSITRPGGEAVVKASFFVAGGSFTSVFGLGRGY